MERLLASLILQAFPEKQLTKLEDFGFIQSRPKGEYHANNQQMSKLLHHAIGLGGKGKAPQVELCLCCDMHSQVPFVPAACKPSLHR